MTGVLVWAALPDRASRPLASIVSAVQSAQSVIANGGVDAEERSVYVSGSFSACVALTLLQ